MASSASSLAQHVARVVDQREALPVGIEDGARYAPPTAPTSRATWLGVLRRRRRWRPAAVEAYGLTASTSAPSLASTLGMTKLVVP